MVKSIILCNIGFLLSIVCEYASEYIKKKVKKKTVAKSSCAWLILGVKSKNAYTPWFYILLFYTYRYCLHREYITRAWRILYAIYLAIYICISLCSFPSYIGHETHKVVCIISSVVKDYNRCKVLTDQLLPLPPAPCLRIDSDCAPPILDSW